MSTVLDDQQRQGAFDARASAGRKFVILDPGLARLGGHNHTFAVTFSDAARAKGYDVLWFCHRDLPAGSAPPYVRVCPVFSLSYYKKVRLRWYAVWAANRLADLVGGSEGEPAQAPDRRETRLARMAARIAARVHPFGREIVAALRAHEVGPDDHVFATTAEYLQYAALVHVVEETGPEARPAFHVRTSFDESYELNRRFGDRLAWPLGRLAALGVVERGVFLYAESEALASHYRRRTGLPFEVLGNPLPSELLAARPVVGPEAHERPLNVVVPGQARTEKGFPRLPAIISELEARPSSRAVRFVVQSNLRKRGKRESRRRKDRDRLAAKEALRRFPPSLVTLVDEPLDTGAYYRLLAEADLVLLPYDAERYRDRPSMIAIEAALLGKPVVVTAGTTLADLAGSAASEVASSDVEFAEGIARIADDYERYQARALARAASLRRTLEPGALLARMIARAAASGEKAQSSVL